MASSGKGIRLARLRGPRGRLLLLALDHGLPAGPMAGIEDPRSLLGVLRDAHLTGVVANPGMVPYLVDADPALPPLVVHLSAGTLLGARPASKVLVCRVDRAVSLGANAVSVQIGFGDPDEDRMVADAGTVVDEANGLGLPVLVMAYPPGATAGSAAFEEIRHAARAAAELGADLVQVSYPGSAEAVRSVVRGCPAPLLVAGGPRNASPEAFLDAVGASLFGGVTGLVVGRNLFQHPNPASFARALADVVFSERPPVQVPSA